MPSALGVLGNVAKFMATRLSAAAWRHGTPLRPLAAACVRGPFSGGAQWPPAHGTGDTARTAAAQ